MKIFNLNMITEGYVNNIAIDFSKGSFSNDADGNNELNRIREAVLSANNIQIDRFKRDWFSPSKITNAIINITLINGLNDPNKIRPFYKFLEDKICKHLVLIFEEDMTVDSIRGSLEILADFNFHSVIIICNYMDAYYSDEFGEIIMSLPIHKKLIVLNSPFEKNFESTMHFTTKKDSYGFRKSRGEFKVSFELFDESQNHHTYFNRKLCIDVNGEIKNAPECQENFGLIQELNSLQELERIISTTEFQKYWFAHKDMCSICQSCEFRHICVDNRLPVQRKNGTWYHTIECNYNPYIAKWKNEDSYVSLCDSGVNVSTEKVTIDHDRIAAINKRIWGD